MDKSLEVTSLIQPLKDLYNSVSDEWKNFFDIGLDDYLYSQTHKYFFTNTFIHRSEKVKFYDIYYPIKAKHNKLTTDFSDIEELFSSYSKIIINGSAGSGKTTLIKHLFLKSLFEKTRIPILIELRHLNDYDGNIEKLITDKILNNNVKPNSKILKRSLQTGKFLFLFDGYDEIFSHKKDDINRQLEYFIDQYSNNNFVISTRPGSGIEIFNRFFDFKVEKLTNEDVINFIDKIVENDERKQRISDIVNDPTNDSYFEFLRNPLLLSMFILAFENHPEIPQKKSAFYRNVFDTLYSKHDGITKNSFPREKQSNLQRDDFEDILSVFSYISSIDGDYKFTEEFLTDTLNKVKESTNYKFETQKFIYDLRTTISILVLDGFEYFFPHRSMQEYFTAFFISRLPTTKKALAYKNIFSALESSSNDNSFTFWNLCKELDNIAFNEIFLLPRLKKIYTKLNVKDEKIKLNNFIEIFQPAVHLSGNEKEVMILRARNLQTSLLTFCHSYNYELLLSHPKNNNCTHKIIELLKDELTNSNLIRISNRRIKLKELLIENNFIDTIDKIADGLRKTIINLQSEVKKTDKGLDKILKR
ncbi:NACHT domain-containing protein [Kaistella faecalis]|uniref:NACHT domain-containing protein n=1 Tax=Kaistella faecalis TaxID=2852098 RepID=UPI001C4378DF|nr:NACHT domain-containing protein [Chryseobacterium faecale]UFK97400.1 NACHT domain-containing protein [Chryseobacterium faecale]